MSSLPLPLWPEAERPREKLLKQGPATLSEAELLAILLQTGTRGQAGPISSASLRPNSPPSARSRGSRISPISSSTMRRTGRSSNPSRSSCSCPPSEALRVSTRT